MTTLGFKSCTYRYAVDTGKTRYTCTALQEKSIFVYLIGTIAANILTRSPFKPAAPG